MTAVPRDDLFPEARNPPGTVAINDRCGLRPQDGHCVLLVSGMIRAQYAVTDRMAQAHAMVSLVEQGWADQIEVARAFHCTVRTVRRQQRRLEERGLWPDSGQDRGYPRGRSRLAPWRRQWVHQLKAQGCGQREIARRIGVSENAVRELLRRLGWKSALPAQIAIAPSHPPDGEWPSNTHPHFPAGLAGRSSGFSDVRSLAARKFLQIL